ncbi:branched-chain amino acid aminotransferase, partial [bacterium]
DPDIAFSTGTAVEIAGIRSIDDYVFKGEWENTIGYKLSQMYKELTTQG